MANTAAACEDVAADLSALVDAELTPVERDALVASIPLGRAATPEDVAATAMFLLCDRTAGYVTGQVLRVNGGLASPYTSLTAG